jgi:hypothetical protein
MSRWRDFFRGFSEGFDLFPPPRFDPPKSPEDAIRESWETVGRNLNDTIKDMEAHIMQSRKTDSDYQKALSETEARDDREDRGGFRILLACVLASGAVMVGVIYLVASRVSLIFG